MYTCANASRQIDARDSSSDNQIEETGDGKTTK